MIRTLDDSSGEPSPEFNSGALLQSLEHYLAQSQRVIKQEWQRGTVIDL